MIRNGSYSVQLLGSLPHIVARIYMCVCARVLVYPRFFYIMAYITNFRILLYFIFDNFFRSWINHTHTYIVTAMMKSTLLLAMIAALCIAGKSCATHLHSVYNALRHKQSISFGHSFLCQQHLDGWERWNEWLYTRPQTDGKECGGSAKSVSSRSKLAWLCPKGRSIA